jgi:hypothetical protein
MMRDTVKNCLNQKRSYVLLLLTATVFLAAGCNNTTETVSPADPDFVQEDLQVSTTTAQIIDPEYNYTGNQVCWQDLDGYMWVAGIDPVTGNILPATGRGTLIDSNLAPIDVTFNGPEWAFTASGPQILYSKVIGGDPYVARATYNGSKWVTEVLQNTANTFNPRATKNATDATAYVYYYSLVQEGIFIRPVATVGEPILIQGTTDAHWVDGENVQPSMSMIRKSDGQVLFYDVATKALTQLTFDAGTKQRPYMWRAPDFNNELLLFARVDKSIRVYRNIGGNWTVINTINSPATSTNTENYSYIASPEPFVYKGISYICYMATGSVLETDNLPAQIWFSAINPAKPLNRRISDDRVAVRSDPEQYFTNTSAFIFYTDLELNGTELNPATQLVLRRGITGLD